LHHDPIWQRTYVSVASTSIIAGCCLFLAVVPGPWPGQSPPALNGSSLLLLLLSSLPPALLLLLLSSLLPPLLLL
jgi:hypothetical protein